MTKLQKNEVMFRQKCSAFTLMEILLALSMIIIILGAVYGSYKATTISVTHCKPKSIIEQQARLFLQRITSELRCSYAGRLNQFRESLFENRPEKEMVREAIQQEEPPFFIGDEVSTGQIFLQFVTSTFSSRPNHSIGGLAILSYRLDESGTILLRNVRRYIERFEHDDDDYQWLPVLTNVKTIKLEYFKDEKWQEQWKSKDIRSLPQAVRISLVLETDETGPLSFTSSAYIMCCGHQIPEVAVQGNTVHN